MNVDSEHICLAMEERSLQEVGDARAERFKYCVVSLSTPWRSESHYFDSVKKRKTAAVSMSKWMVPFYLLLSAPRCAFRLWFSTLLASNLHSPWWFFPILCPRGEFILLFPTFTFLQKNNTGKITIAAIIMANNTVAWTNHASKLLAEKMSVYKYLSGMCI